MVSDIEVVRQAGSLAEVRGKLKGVEVAIIERMLHDGESLDLIGEPREVRPGAMVLAMGLRVEELPPLAALAAGAEGIVGKAVLAEQIVAYIRKVVRR